MKNILKTVLILLIFSFTSCEKDLYEDAIKKSNPSFALKKISLKDLSRSKNPKLFAEVDQFRKINENYSSRIVYDSIHNFYFDDENGKLIEHPNGYDSYTFPIINPNSYGKIENLVFSKTRNGEYIPYKVEYSFTAEELKNLSISQLNHQTTTYINLNTSRESFPCIEWDEWVDAGIGNQGELGTGNTYNFDLVTRTINCVVADEDATSGSMGTTVMNSFDPYFWQTTINPNPNSGQNINNSNNPVATSPVTHTVPCEELKNKTSRTPAYRLKFLALHTTQNFNAQNETGFAKIGNQYVTLSPKGDHKLNIPPNSKNYTHVHNNIEKEDLAGDMFVATIKIHSPQDLEQLITTCIPANLDAGLNATDAFGVVLSDEGNFALKVTDGNINMATLNAGWGKFLSSYNKFANDVLSDYSLNADQRSEKLQEMLLAQLEILGLKDNISLYQAALDEDPDGNQIIRWARKTLNSEKKVINNPC